ncbi:MAG TPA: D-alanyl-D-alanine carboxypeptidase/D-alanyl-D-alanine-endopeptidase [Marmoricola sp.]|nr:D-alanyl-D-alanine carboxypeptidase/D-alanyl-D-alanine-endopeptidase [Marmoricola sp.]
MRDKRHWLVEILVLCLLLGAFAAWKWDLMDRFVGTDAQTDPVAVSPPEGLDLPSAAAPVQLAREVTPRAADPALVASAVQPLLDRRVLGPRIAVLVQNLSDGATVFQRGVREFTPASTLKLATATASLSTLGEMTRFRTTVKYDAATGALTLVGGGDPYLASTRKKDLQAYPTGGTLAELTAQVAQVLKDQDQNQVPANGYTLHVDESLFTGPAISPAWPANYVPDSVVSPISPLWVDQARSGFRFASDPALQAGQVFRRQLGRAGVPIHGAIHKGPATTAAQEIAGVDSAPVGEIVEEMLAMSDNQAAEVLSRQVGLKAANDPSFTGGAQAVQQALGSLGVNIGGNNTYDGSGLSRENRLTAESLAQTIRVAASADHPTLRAAITGVPVAGFTGSLKWRFVTGPADALGRVRAKTGTLTGVHGLAGVTAAADGTQLVFVMVADRVAPEKGGLAQQQLDRIAGALGACGCGVGSHP